MTRPYEGPRGLIGFTEFTDTYGNRLRVQEATAIDITMVDAPGQPPHCWVRIEGKKSSASAHLTVEMAKELILGLAEFVGRSSRRDAQAIGESPSWETQ